MEKFMSFNLEIPLLDIYSNELQMCSKISPEDWPLDI